MIFIPDLIQKYQQLLAIIPRIDHPESENKILLLKDSKNKIVILNNFKTNFFKFKFYILFSYLACSEDLLAFFNVTFQSNYVIPPCYLTVAFFTIFFTFRVAFRCNYLKKKNRSISM